jgi:hypothetical protein
MDKDLCSAELFNEVSNLSFSILSEYNLSGCEILKIEHEIVLLSGG